MIKPDEFTLIIKGWFDNKSDLLMSASSINFSVLSKCRVVSVDDGNVVLWSSKEDSVFRFSVESPHLSVRYCELREFADVPGFLDSVPDDKRFRSALLVTLPLEALMPEFSYLDRSIEKIILLEL